MNAVAPEAAGHVRIIARPAGEAPEWVRNAWIGLELPLSLGGSWVAKSFGVLSAPQTWIGQMLGLWLGRAATSEVYFVNAKAAVDILADKQPDAARWWRDNVGHMLDGKIDFAFDIDACSWISTASWPKRPKL